MYGVALPNQGTSLLVGGGGGVYSPRSLSPLLWLDSTIPPLSDGAAGFASASSQNFSLASNSTIQPGAAGFAWSFWVNFNTLGDFQVILAKGLVNSNATEYGIYRWTDNKLYFHVSNNTTSVELGTSFALTANTWHFVCVWQDAVGQTLNIQVDNGKIDSLADTIGTYVGTNALQIGWDGTAGHYYLNASLDSVGFVKGRFWTQAERTALFNPAAPSGNGNNPGTFQNGPTWAADSPAVLGYGECVNFNGTSGQYISTANNTGILGNAAFTLSAWIKPADTTTQGGFLSFGPQSSTGGTPGLFVNLRGAGVISAEYGSNTPAASAGPALVAGTWYHVAVVKTPGAINTTTTIYINGVSYGLGGSPSSSTPNILAGAPYIGCYSSNTGNTANAKVSDARIYSRALPSVEVANLANGNNPDTSCLVLWEKLNEGTGTTAKDSSPGAGQGVTWATAPTAVVTKGAAEFNGTNQCLSVASNAGLQTGNANFSLCCWFKTTSTGSIGIVTKTTFSGTGEFDLYMSSGRISFQTFAGSVAVGNYLTSISSYNDGNWHFAVGVQDIAGNRIGFSIDGGAFSYVTLTGTSTSGASPFTIAAFAGLSQYLAGSIDGVGFWNGRTLSAADVAVLWNGGQGLSYSGLTVGLKTSLTSFWDLSNTTNLLVDAVGTNTLTNNNGVGITDGVMVDGTTSVKSNVNAWYDFESAGTGLLVDSSGNSNTLTNVNAVTLVAGIVSGNAVDDGQPVTTILDQSGNAVTVSQSIAAKRSSLKLAIKNGKNILRYDGVSDLYPLSVSLGTTYTIFFAGNLANVANNVVLGSTNTSYLMYFTTGNIYTNVNGSSFVSVPHGYTAGTWVIFAIRRNGTNVRFYKNGVQLGTDQTLAVNGAVTLDMIGAEDNGTFYAPMDLGTLFVCPTSLSDVNVAQMFIYLDAQWAVY